MLDTQTKRRIDDCRDILVGKLPDPKAQIEQITIGLIYKFMDDMDKEAIELGGAAKFFSADYEKYAWDNLFDTKVTATQMLGLYSGAIESMEKNPNIPQLFRDIFKNAYLPYRDPETLKMFLKTIGKFEYTHSEKLGDAFEYLLSIMGSQGDAGQFRTPRHIIDFLVAVVDPDIGESILDPACGTAGFLISAYKHILLKHTKANKEGLNIYTYNNLENKEFNNLGDKLTPDHRKRLIQDIAGYDISPDMVRLSLVNLYLHGFPDPEINEYDTLSSEERWKEDFDVVLANPPFMSPKGGIRPHKRFTIASNRSEVLFVDYIAEHLTPKGKAGIIVPEGVIFQGGKAYKDLRKMLVENHLYAVVSLPAGVFNPYSGVKTSILLMDKSVATKRNDILFVKIDNDGYNLGAQRAAVKGGQLEEAIAIIKAFRNADPSRHAELVSASAKQTHHRHAELVSASVKQTRQRHAEQGRHAELVSASPLASASPNTISHAVLKSEIAAKGDYNLNGERYKKTIAINTQFDLKSLGDLCNIFGGGTPSRSNDEYWNDGDIKWISARHINNDGQIINSDFITQLGLENSSSKIAPKDSIIFVTRVSVGKYAIAKDDYAINQDLTVLIPKVEKMSFHYLYTIAPIIAKEIDRLAIGIGVRGINRKQLSEIQIPLPPLSIQEEIVAEIESYQKIIDSAKAIVENYKPRIDIDPEWEMVELGEIIKLSSGKGLTSKDMIEGPYSVYGGNGINGHHCEYFIEESTIVIGRVGAYCGAVHITNPKSWITDNGLYVTSYLKRIEIKYLSQLLIQLDINRYAKVGGQPSISQKTVTELSIPVPSAETQQQIVSQIEKEQELVNANKQLIEIFEQKIKDRIGKVWGVNKKQEEALGIAAEPEGEYERGASC